MQSKDKVRERMEDITKEIRNNKTVNMNSLLSPEPYGYDEDNLSAQIRFVRKDCERNERGEIHGGAISAMFDTAMGMTVLAYSDSEGVSTADLSVSFIRPFLGDSYIVKTEIIHLGRSLVRVRATAYDEGNGKALASATSNFVHVK